MIPLNIYVKIIFKTCWNYFQVMHNIWPRHIFNLEECINDRWLYCVLVEYSGIFLFCFCSFLYFGGFCRILLDLNLNPTLYPTLGWARLLTTLRDSWVLFHLFHIGVFLFVFFQIVWKFTNKFIRKGRAIKMKSDNNLNSSNRIRENKVLKMLVNNFRNQ